jgi:outer membrane protein assembly factor BamB
MGLLTSLSLKKEGRLTEKWTYDSKSSLLCGPSVSNLNNDGDESIVIATKNGTIICLDENASLKWEFRISEKIDSVDLMFLEAESIHSILTPPQAYDIDGDGKKEIIFGTQLGTLYVLSSQGKLLWKFATGSAIRGGALSCDINNDGKMEIIFGSDDKKLYVLTNKGKLLWTHTLSCGIQTTPAASQKQRSIVFGDDDGNINCLSFEKKILWSYQTGGKILAEPTIATLSGEDGELIFCGSTDNKIYALDFQGNLRWAFQTQGSILAKCIVADIDEDGITEILVTSCDNSVYMISRDGEKIWSYQTDFWIGSPPVLMDIDNDKHAEVIVGSYDHNLYVLSGEGSYVLDHIPGLSNIIHQAGHYADIQTQDPGENIGKKIWQYGFSDIIMGIAHTKKDLIVAVKTGKIVCLSHTR